MLFEFTRSCQRSPTAGKWLYPETCRLETWWVQKLGWTVVDTISGDDWVCKTRARPSRVYCEQGEPLHSEWPVPSGTGSSKPHNYNMTTDMPLTQTVKQQLGTDSRRNVRELEDHLNALSGQYVIVQSGWKHQNGQIIEWTILLYPTMIVEWGCDGLLLVQWANLHAG